MVQLTRFERARLISSRALQLSFGAPPLIKPTPEIIAFDLATEELQQGVLPLVVLRRYPDGKVEKVSV